MIPRFLPILALLATLGQPSAASAQQLLTRVGQGDLDRLVEAVDGNVRTSTPDDTPSVVFEDPDGLIMVLRGRACEGDFCRGLQIEATWDTQPHYTAETLNVFNRRYAAVKAELEDDGDAFLSRYLILDEGQTFENLVLNVNVFASLASKLPEVVQEAAAGPAIDWGDDSSRWSNDGECDDPRFEGAGSASTTLDSDLKRDATDCRQLFEAGQIRLKG